MLLHCVLHCSPVMKFSGDCCKLGHLKDPELLWELLTRVPRPREDLARQETFCRSDCCIHLLQVFEQHCTNAWDEDRGSWRSCFSDEHYFATVLATKGLDEVCNCLNSSIPISPALA